jgi:hypothetical protein
MVLLTSLTRLVSHLVNCHSFPGFRPEVCPRGSIYHYIIGVLAFSSGINPSAFAGLLDAQKVVNKGESQSQEFEGK